MNSISDTNDYKEFCTIATQNDEVFKSFKINPTYNGILEHVSYEQGLLYLQYLNNNFPEFIEKIELFKKNDLLGSPKTYIYENIGRISPTTLRYIKVLSDLKNLFGDLSGKKIIEIGVGYGGQCFILNQLFNIKEYVLVDLDEALLLSKKYLSNLGVEHRVLKIDEIDNLDEDFDLVISNYAYSELSRELQEIYYDKIIKKSKNGYFTFNFISDIFGINSFSYEEVVEKFSEKNLQILTEYPETFENNKIIYFNSESHSQVKQDLWVLEMTKYKKGGFFLDVGAYDGVSFSNSYLLEKNYDWKGLLIEAHPDTFKRLCEYRNNICLNYAVTSQSGKVKFENFSYTGSKISENGELIVDSINFIDIFKNNFVPKTIDYMSLDIEGGEYDALLSFPFEEYICNLMTIEHNLYIDGPEKKQMIIELLLSKGYVLYRENVECDGNPFEDWYVHNTFFVQKKFSQIFSKLKIDGVINIGQYTIEKKEMFLTSTDKIICIEPSDRKTDISIEEYYNFFVSDKEDMYYLLEENQVLKSKRMDSIIEEYNISIGLYNFLIINMEEPISVIKSFDNFINNMEFIYIELKENNNSENKIEEITKYLQNYNFKNLELFLVNNKIDSILLQK
jgi:FkbM family methyltransferase